MKKPLFLFVLIISSFHIFSQELISPLISETFGLNNHTNRDISYFSHIDGNDNTIIIGTTEKDSTFTDIIVTKIDSNSNMIWQKRVSQETDLSYDIPEKSFVSVNNETYVIGRSAFNQSNFNGLIFIIKLNEDGDIIYNTTIGNTDGSDYKDYNYMDVDLNSDGTLSLVYNPTEFDTPTNNDFIFLKINNEGNINNSFTKEISADGITGKIKNDTFYFLTQELIDEINNYSFSYNYYKIENANNQHILPISNPEFLNYYYTAMLSEHVKLSIDDSNNSYLTCNNISNNNTIEKINISKIDSNNSLVYSLTTSSTNNYNLVDSFINNQNENIVVANNINDNRIDFLSVDPSNVIQTQSNTENILATGFKQNNDGSFFITTSNSNIRLFSNTLTEQTSFNTSNSFELADFSKINNQTISAIGTSYSKMFPTSDFFTQLDIEAEKINSTQVLNTYSYSGIGTSKAFQQRVIIDNDNNYLVLVTEKMGPGYLGGSNPPLNKRIIKYNSDLVKLWEVEIPDNIFNLVNHGGRDIDFFIDNANNLYLNLPRTGNNYGLGYDLYKVTPSGSLDFINNTYVVDKFSGNDDYIFMASNYFSYEDSSKFYVLDKITGNLINETEVAHEKFIDIFTSGDDYYFYTYESITNNTPDFINLYKNGVKQYTRSLTDNYGIYPYHIDDNGTLFFSTNYGPENRLNKLDIYNNFSFYNTVTDIIGLKAYNNGNIFLFLDNDNTLILDSDLNLFSNGESIAVTNIHLMAHGNYILLGTYYDNNIRIINANGYVIKHLYTQSGNLHNWYSKFDNEGNLILVGQDNNRISTFNEYGWARGFIHSFGTIDNRLGTEDIDVTNLNDELRIYPNPTSKDLNIEIKNKSIESITVFDLSGKQLQTFSESKIDLSRFDSGIYLLTIITTAQHIINTKIIKN